MNRRIAVLAALALLGGCNGAAVTSPVAGPVTASTASRDLAALQQGAAEGQLFCQAGPSVLGMFDPSGAALLAKGATGAAVAKVCSLVGGAAVALQNVTVTPGGVKVQLPASITIPTRLIS